MVKYKIFLDSICIEWVTAKGFRHKDNVVEFYTGDNDDEIVAIYNFDHIISIEPLNEKAMKSRYEEMLKIV